MTYLANRTKVLMWLMVLVWLTCCSVAQLTSRHPGRLLSVGIGGSTGGGGGGLNISIHKEGQPIQAWSQNQSWEPGGGDGGDDGDGDGGGGGGVPLGSEDGVVMTVLHQVTGSVLLTKTFNTWHVYTYAHDLRWWLKKVEAGRVVVLRVRRAGTYGLEAALPVLAHLGSLLAAYAPPRALWMWVFVAGGRTLLETLAPTPRSLHRSVTALQSHTFFSVASPTSVTPSTPTALQQLCNTHSALGPLCDPVQPPVLPSPVVDSEEENVVGVVVCAGGRLQYLIHTLTHLLLASHVTTSRILVVLGTNPQSGQADPNVLTLLRVLHLRHRVVNIPREAPSFNHRLFQFYRGAWTAGMESFPQARYLAFLDEDVEVSHDWLEMLLHLAPALEEDSSLWCVSGTSAAHINVRSDPRLITRGSRQPGWGFLVPVKEVKKAVATWPDTSTVSLLYDTFLYHTLGQGRECIYPILSRAQHYGVGVNTVPEVHHFYFLERPLHDGSPTTLPAPASLTWDNFETRVWSRLSAAVPFTNDPCSPGFFPKPTSLNPPDYVFYFFLDSLESSLEWTILAECVGAWPYSTQGLHRGSVELPQSWGGSLWLVGVPASPYRKLKPPNIKVWVPREQDNIKQQTFFSNTWRPLPNLVNRTLHMAASQLFIPNCDLSEKLIHLP